MVVLLSDKALREIQEDSVAWRGLPGLTVADAVEGLGEWRLRFERAIQADREALVPAHQHPLRPGDVMDPECLHCKGVAR